MDFFLRFDLNAKDNIKHGLLLGARPAFVCALMLGWRETKAKKHKDRIASFVSLNRGRLDLVFGPGKITQIMNNYEAPVTIKDQIVAAVAANELGEALFDDLAQSLLSRQVTDTITNEVVKLRGENLDKTVLDAKVREIVAAASAGEAAKLLKPRRSVVVKYRGIDVISDPIF